MKKIIITAAVSLLFCLFIFSPSAVKADAEIGLAFVYYNGISDTNYAVVPIYANVTSEVKAVNFHSATSRFRALYYNPSSTYTDIYFLNQNDSIVYCNKSYVHQAYVGTMYNDYTWSSGNETRAFWKSIDDFYAAIPEEYRPEDSVLEQVWDNFYDLYYDLFGFYPLPGSLFDLLRKLALGDDSESTEITFPTMTPSPTPTPTPTPIPVQTIFVPDGNGNTTIIYQYPDPTTGVITQSPYNPNIENNITIHCDCGGDNNGNDILGTNPQDPYTLTSSMLWADGFGVEISDNPLTAANESQKTLAEAASEYSDAVNVASNSFNILPVKWLTLIGLLGGILIIAGLIRTFLGG